MSVDRAIYHSDRAVDWRLVYPVFFRKQWAWNERLRDQSGVDAAFMFKVKKLKKKNPKPQNLKP